jgi:hypothetical protein
VRYPEGGLLRVSQAGLSSIVARQVSLPMLKSVGFAPVKVNPPPILSGAELLLVMVTGWASLTVPWGTAVGEPKVSDVGLRSAVDRLGPDARGPARRPRTDPPPQRAPAVRMPLARLSVAGGPGQRKRAFHGSRSIY